MKTNNKGMTLIELMITVAIIGILVSVAYPAYTHYVKKAECSDGINALQELAGFMEEFYMVQDTYDGAPVAKSDSPEKYYKISITAQTAFLYELTATPVDTDEMILTLDSLGQKGESGGSANAASCW
jgi:type IV pilus assembly protein PilE